MSNFARHVFAWSVAAAALASVPQKPAAQKPPPPAAPQKPAPSQSAIDAAIDRGVKHVLDLFADGGGPTPGRPRNPFELSERSGLRALTAYALLESRVPGKHPVVQQLFARLACDDITMTYDRACMLLALSALDSAGPSPIDAATKATWVDELARALLESQLKTGDFGYPVGADLSNTQYAALGMRAAAAAGVHVPPERWIQLANGVLRYRTHDGGFAYGPFVNASNGGNGATGSMTTAGVGTLAICEGELARAGALAPELETKFRAARRGGLEWLAEHLTIDSNPGAGAWTHYYLYGLERVGALAGVELIGKHDWYREGATFLLETQDGSGGWNGTFEREPTLFALLFLRRATAVAVGPRTAEPGSLGSPSANLRKTSAGFVTLVVEEEEPLRVAIDGFALDVNRALSWPGEKTFGPHVARVEYLVDDRVVAVALGDEEHASGDARYGCELHAIAPGRHVLTARVVALVPPDGAGPTAGAPPSSKSGPKTRELVSGPITLDVHGDPPPRWLAFDREADLVLRPEANATATASSVRGSSGTYAALEFGARHAIDGNVRAPWIAEARDEQPMVRVTLRRGQRADRVRVRLARLVPDGADFLADTSTVTMRINGEAPRPVTVDLEGRAELTLPRPITVASIELRLAPAAQAGKSVGVGEVELFLGAR